MKNALVSLLDAVQRPNGSFSIPVTCPDCARATRAIILSPNRESLFSHKMRCPEPKCRAELLVNIENATDIPHAALEELARPTMRFRTSAELLAAIKELPAPESAPLEQVSLAVDPQAPFGDAPKTQRLGWQGWTPEKAQQVIASLGVR